MGEDNVQLMVRIVCERVSIWKRGEMKCDEERV